MRGSHILFQPALEPDFHRIVCIVVIIKHLCSSANKRVRTGELQHNRLRRFYRHRNRNTCARHTSNGRIADKRHHVSHDKNLICITLSGFLMVLIQATLPHKLYTVSSRIAGVHHLDGTGHRF